MIFSIVVCFAACAGLIVSVLLKPSVRIKGHNFSIYWLPAFAGALLLLCGVLPAKEAWAGLTASGEMNPLKILALFVSLTFLSVYLDELGFFRRLACVLLRRAKGSQKKLFFCLYALVSVLTVFTSNDIVVLTFTPFICCFCKEERISPVPYLVGEFVAANTWSMMLVIGNPTNIYLASACGIEVGEYVSVMWLPTLLAGLVALFGLWLLFCKQLSLPVAPVVQSAEIADGGLLAIGVAHLAVCVVCLAVSSYIHLPMWIAATAFAASLGVCTLAYAAAKKRFKGAGRLLFTSFKRAPWELVPFVLSMFLIVLSLQKYGVTERLASLLSGKGALWKYGAASFFSANVVNNIPMSVLFGGVLTASETSAASVYATIVGSNLGAYLTPIGALAGIMWTGLLKTYRVDFSFRRFVVYGAALSLPALAAALFGLWLVL